MLPHPIKYEVNVDRTVMYSSLPKSLIERLDMYIGSRRNGESFLIESLKAYINPSLKILEIIFKIYIRLSSFFATKFSVFSIDSLHAPPI